MAAPCEAIIVGAGLGRRLGATPRPKVLLPLGGEPVLAYSLGVFAALAEVRGLILVVPAGEEDPVRSLCQRLGVADRAGTIVAGGPRRQDSVRAGLDRLDPATEIVLVHDAARPLVTPALVRRVLAAAERHGAATPGIPIADTLKRVSANQSVVRTLDRRNLVAVQTPQGFQRALLLRAYAAAWERGLTATDDAGLLEYARLPVQVVPGESMNFKLTTQEDFILAGSLLEGWRQRCSASE